MKALFFTRMFTLMVSCLMYLSIVKEDNWFGYVFIAAGAAMYAANHVLLTKETNAIWFCLIDIAIGFSFGFIFPGTGLFIIMLCPVAVAFFLRGFPKRTAWSVLCL